MQFFFDFSLESSNFGGVEGFFGSSLMGLALTTDGRLESSFLVHRVSNRGLDTGGRLVVVRL